MMIQNDAMIWENNWRSYKICGDWNVYGDEESAKCLFCKYKHCREVYMSVYGAGRKFVDMLVSA